MRLLTCCIPFLAAIAIFSGPSYAQSWSVTRIEEDWELVLGQPSPIQDSPQISTWMSPTGNLDNECFAADFNHAQRPDFSSGGFQVKAMNGDVLMSDKISDNGDNFIYDNEQVKWTQSMEIVGGSLEFKVINGTSESWGSFGGSGMKVRFLQSPVENLNGYSVNDSARWAGVGFGGNRVESLALKRVRYYVNGQFFATVEVNLEIE